MLNKKLILIGVLVLIVMISGYFLIRQNNTFFNSLELSTNYSDKDGRFTFKVPRGFNVKEYDEYTAIYKEEHRKLIDSDNKYANINYILISVRVVKNLPKNEDPELPVMPVIKTNIEGKEVTIIEVVPSNQLNKYFYTPLKEGFLELGIDPYWEQTSEYDDPKLINTSKELEQGIKEIITSLEVK